MGHRKLFPGLNQYNRHVNVIICLIKYHGWREMRVIMKGVFKGDQSICIFYYWIKWVNRKWKREIIPGEALPLVFLVSDHSSTKYTLINYMLGQQNQTDEVALMDNCFMVVAPGPADDHQVKRPLDPHHHCSFLSWAQIFLIRPRERLRLPSRNVHSNLNNPVVHIVNALEMYLFSSFVLYGAQEIFSLFDPV